MVALLVASARSGSATAATGCALPQPSFSYIDVDNDGCHTTGVDSDSIDADLKQPSFVGPAGTGLVIPNSLVLPNQANPHWSIPNDVWIDGRIGGPSELTIEAGGTTYINGSIRIKASGDGYEGDTTLGCTAGCGPVVVGNGARLSANGYFTIYDASFGDDVRVAVPCAPGGDPSCYAWLDLVRPVSIGHRFRVRSPGGIMLHDGASPLTIGDDLRLQTKSVFTDGGTLSFDIEIYPMGGVTIGARANIRAGGTLMLGAGASGPLSIGTGAKLAGTGIGVRLTGTSIDIGSASTISARYEVDSAQFMPLRLTAQGPIDIGDGVRIFGGSIRLDAGIGALALGENVYVDSSGRTQRIDLLGAAVSIGAGSTLDKTVSDRQPVLVSASSAVSISSSALRGSGLDVSVSDAGGSIVFTSDEVRGDKVDTDDVAIFRTPAGGSCDLSGSTFVHLDLDVSQCSSVTGP